MAEYTGAKVKAVREGSIAEELDINPGDALLRINGTKLLDYIDFLYYGAETELVLEVLKPSGEIVEYEFEKDSDEPLGLVLEESVFDGIRTCANHCLFCFVHQLPKNQRASLYVQDDDYRLSFLNGCYITLTNMTEEDWRRIESLRLSPLYVSVHATDPAIRCKLLGSKLGGAIMQQLERLTAGGISVHTQAVLCPGINDGPVLERTIKDLAGFWPGVSSLALVPVGLTAHRDKLYPLRLFSQEEAERVLDLVTRYQQKYQAELGSRFVFAADEWYLLAKREFPEAESYEGYPQLDNGVGLISWFCGVFDRVFPEFLPKLRQLQLNLVVITGKSAARMLDRLIDHYFQNMERIKIEILPVENHFFGATVTVTGLLAGHDIAKAILNHCGADDPLYLIPQITLRQGEDTFLDGLSLNGLRTEIGTKRCAVVPTQADAWLEWITSKGMCE